MKQPPVTFRRETPALPLTQSFSHARVRQLLLAEWGHEIHADACVDESICPTAGVDNKVMMY